MNLIEAVARSKETGERFFRAAWRSLDPVPVNGIDFSRNNVIGRDDILADDWEPVAGEMMMGVDDASQDSVARVAVLELAEDGTVLRATENPPNEWSAMIRDTLIAHNEKCKEDDAALAKLGFRPVQGFDGSEITWAQAGIEPIVPVEEEPQPDVVIEKPKP